MNIVYNGFIAEESCFNCYKLIFSLADNHTEKLGGRRMVSKEVLYFDSRDNINRIHAVKWIPDIKKPKCILQIIHGMAEYIERYDEFANAMAEKGILVVGEDHLGHGKSVGDSGTYGYFCERDMATVVVRDSHRLKKMIQERYPGVPYIILGHSMGSFILRNYLCRYGTGIQAAIIMGTGMQSKPVITMGKAVAAVQEVFYGSKHPSKLLNALSFGTYNKKIENNRTLMDWLSKDEKVVDAYIEDPLCGFLFTVNGFQTIFQLLGRLHKKENLKNMPEGLPVLFLSGEEDPVGDYGKGVRDVYQSFIDLGMKRVEMKLYTDDRHEILNETNREQVYEDIYRYIQSVI